MKSKLFLHFLLCLGIYLGLAIIEIFIARPILDWFTSTDFIKMIIYLVLLIILNPIGTYFLKNLVKIEQD